MASPRDLARARAVLAGGRPTELDLDKFRYRKDGSISGDAPLGMRLHRPPGDPGYDRLPALCRAVLADRVARLAAVFHLLTAAPVAVVCGARLEEFLRQMDGSVVWRPADWGACRLDTPAEEVFKEAVRHMGDDGTAYYISHLLKRDRQRPPTGTASTEEQWRDWLSLPPPPRVDVKAGPIFEAIEAGAAISRQADDRPPAPLADAVLSVLQQHP